ncbi:aminopeptidase N [Tistlia consotensis]|uniref:Aminopeptidase N n=1 Tax=Tistlia consotensis USBA 355 TaxID=560819 RepID=A0A1Y6C7U0_9PROT|nr:aminopeptidase N [Tistlia consotensis]SMF40643.1 aminopeptidase N [Tistlia consotensis USBA 355]SNR74639.1 aminopeptidase N [Tistlia consotensis]
MDRTVSPSAPQPTRLSDYRPPAHLIETLDLALDLRDDWTTVRATLRGRRNPAAGQGAAPIVLDGEAQELVSVTLDGERLGPNEYALEADRLTLPERDGAFELVVESRIRPQDNSALEGLYLSNGMYCTQCEAEGFRRITYFPDRPDVMAVYSVRLEADAARFPVLLSNGNPVEQGEAGAGRRYAVWHDPFPKPSYLFAAVAGDLACVEDRFVTRSGREVALRIYVEHGNEPRTGHAMDSLKRAMRWDEEVFGLEYDLDLFMIVAVSHFNMGAMENKGLNVFNSKLLLADAATATDADLQRVEAVVAHEYFHNWTGNRVTCRDWFQLSLKEGLTVFRDQQFSADMHSHGVKRVGDVRLLRSVQFAEDAGPTAHPVRPDSYIEINNFYTPTVYEKGAEVVRMIHTLLGPAGFRRGMDLYFERHDGQAVTCEDFVAAMEDANGADLSSFRLWYQQAGTPTLEADWSQDLSARSLTLRLRQSVPPTPGQPLKRPMPLPVRAALLGKAGGTVAPERVLLLDGAEASFTFEEVGEPAVPSLLRGFSAPVRLEAAWSEDDLAFLAGADDDPFGRWEALQTLATRSLLRMAEALRAGGAATLDQRIVSAFRASLADARLEPAFKAELLTLPGETLLGQASETWQVDAVHEARELARRTLGEALRDGWRQAYQALAGEEGALDTEAMGRRAFKNAALAYWVAAGDEAAVAAALAQARPDGRMTDVVAALAALSDLERPDAEAALQAFHDRWLDDPLVLDKWFALKATASRPDTLATVEALRRHPRFDRRNPNRVRALIGSFTTGNPVRFHAADGSGYAFLAQEVLALDKLNPQVAARLTQPLVRWRRFDEGRRQRMLEALRRIADEPGLSRDVFEIVSKGLA